jgi:Ni,Fe-hydrogenase III component G
MLNTIQKRVEEIINKKISIYTQTSWTGEQKTSRSSLVGINQATKEIDLLYSPFLLDKQETKYLIELLRLKEQAQHRVILEGESVWTAIRIKLEKALRLKKEE